MIPQKFYNVDSVKEDEQIKHISIQLKSYFDILNRGLVLQDNVRGKFVSVAFTAINTDKSVPHGLNFTPTGYIVTGLTAAMTVYTGDTAWNSENIVLKSSALGTAQILVF